MICPKCGIHDAEELRGVLVKAQGFRGDQIMDVLMGRFKPEPLDPPIAWCTECDYEAETREQFDQDCENSPHYERETL